MGKLPRFMQFTAPATTVAVLMIAVLVVSLPLIISALPPAQMPRSSVKLSRRLRLKYLASAMTARGMKLRSPASVQGGFQPIGCG
jgi:hypothetical protein